MCISFISSIGVGIYTQCFSHVMINKKKDQKFMENLCHVNMLSIINIHQPSTNMNLYILFAKLPKIIATREFSPNLFKLRRGILLPLTK